MYSAILYFVIITAAAAAIAAVSGIRIGRAFAPAICLTGLVTSVLLTTGLVTAVPYVFGAFGVVGIGVTAAVVIKDKKRAKNILTTGLAVFAVLAVGAILLNAGRYYYLNDEFSHWGLAVKNLYTVGKLPLSGETNALFPAYPPFATAICYLGTCFSKTLCEGATFVPLDLLMVASLLPFVTGYTDQCEKKNCIISGRFLAAVPAAAILFCLLCFKFSALTSISVDTLLGAMTFFLVWELIQGKKAVNYASAAVTAAALVLVKETGLAFAVCGMIAAVAVIIVQKREPLKEKLRLFAGPLCAVLSAAGAKVFWSIALSISGATGDGEGIAGGLVRIFSEGFTETQRQTTKAFFAAWIKPSISFGLPLVLVVCIFALVQLGVIFLLKKTEFEGIGYAVCLFGAVTVCFFFYSFGLLASYWTVFTPGEAVEVASFERYIGSYLVFWLGTVVAVALCVLLPELLSRLGNAWKEKPLRIVSAAVSLLIALALVLVLGVFYPNKASDSAAARASNNYGSDIPALCEEVGADPSDSVLFIASNFETRMHLIANYNAAPRTVEGMYDLETMLDGKHASFVYFQDVDDEALVESVAGKIAVPEGETIQAGRLYRVAGD